MTQLAVSLYDKTVHVELTPAAARALAQRTTPLFAEIHLIFGCMIVKRVRFKDAPQRLAVSVTDKLFVHFRPVRYQKSCRLSDIDADENPDDFPMVAERRGFVPDRLRIDYRAGQWSGDFTYDRSRLAHG